MSFTLSTCVNNQFRSSHPVFPPPSVVPFLSLFLLSLPTLSQFSSTSYIIYSASSAFSSHEFPPILLLSSTVFSIVFISFLFGTTFSFPFISTFLRFHPSPSPVISLSFRLPFLSLPPYSRLPTFIFQSASCPSTTAAPRPSL